MNAPTQETNSANFRSELAGRQSAYALDFDTLREYLVAVNRLDILTTAGKVPRGTRFMKCFECDDIAKIGEAMAVLEESTSGSVATLEAKIAVVQWTANVKDGFINDDSLSNKEKMRVLLQIPKIFGQPELQVHWMDIIHGLLTEIVAYKVCLECNLKPRFATPIEDIQVKADFWVDDAPIQVKKLPQTPFDVHVVLNTLISTTVNRVAVIMQLHPQAREVTPKMITHSLHNSIESIVPYFDLLPYNDYKTVRKLLLNFIAYKQIREKFPENHHILINTHDKNIIGQNIKEPIGELSQDFIKSASKKIENALAIRRVSKRCIR